MIISLINNRRAIHEKIVHRVRYPRFVGRDGIIRPSTAYATMGVFIYQRLNIQKFIKSDDYIAHIICSESESGWLLATSKCLLFLSFCLQLFYLFVHL